MAAAAGAVGAWLNLVGPASTAFTQLIELSSKMPAVTNWFGWVDPDGQPGSVVNVGVGMFSGGDEDDFGGDGLKIAGFTAQGLFIGGGSSATYEPRYNRWGRAEQWQIRSPQHASLAADYQSWRE